MIGQLLAERAITNRRQILLIDKASIARYKNLNTVFFRRLQEFAIFQFLPSHVGGRNDLMIAERAEIGS
jgi:hypothetical protein